jgi:hypothetical protein
LLTGFSRDAVCSDDKNGVRTEGLTSHDTIKVVRVIALSTIPAAVVNPYPSLEPYIDHVKANVITKTIQGTFDTVTTYKFIAVIDSVCALVMTGTITTNSVRNLM